VVIIALCEDALTDRLSSATASLQQLQTPKQVRRGQEDAVQKHWRQQFVKSEKYATA